MIELIFIGILLASLSVQEVQDTIKIYDIERELAIKFVKTFDPIEDILRSY